MTLWKLSSPKISDIAWALLIMGTLLLCSLATASEFQYFNGGIDFWHVKKDDAKTQARTTSEPRATTASTPTKGDDISSGGAFSWKKYLDPKNKEFFKEGDYTPPEPFMEIVRNPTDENLKLWFAYIDKKNELASRLATRVQEYTAKSAYGIAPKAKEEMLTKVAALPLVAPDVKRYRFRMYFDSHCPHCHRMFETLSELQHRGYMVEARQVDDDARELSKIPFATEKATKQEIQDKAISSVPLLLIGDLKNKVVLRLTGFQTTGDVFRAIAQGEGDTKL